MINPRFKNIIFDFGGVICDIDISITEKAFHDLGMKTFDQSYSVTERDNFFGAFETGFITPEQFRNGLKPFFSAPVTDITIDQAWNALLLGIPSCRIDLLKQLRHSYRLFLLSNTNQIHFEKYSSDLLTDHGIPDFHHLFDKTYFSYQIGLRKPFPETFQFVVKDAGIKPEESLFIDDSAEHVAGAGKAGLFAYQLIQGETINDLFSPEMKFLRKV